MRNGTNLQVAYFDQMRTQLDLNRSLADVFAVVGVGASQPHVGTLGGPVAKGSAGSNTRYWGGATIGLMTLGTPSNPPWHHFVVAIAAAVALCLLLESRMPPDRRVAA